MNTRILAAATAIALLAVAFSVSTKGSDDLKTRIDNAHSDLAKAQAPIPHEALHARALEILRGITMAADDKAAAEATAKAAAERCVMFEKTPMDQVNCK